MLMDYNPRLKALVLQAVDNQLNENNPMYVRETFDRLIVSGKNKQQAKEAIAAALIGEIYEVMKNKVPFNDERYHRELNKLK